MTRHTYGQRAFRLLEPFTPQEARLLLEAIRTSGHTVDPRIAHPYTAFLHYAARTEDAPTFLREIATYLQAALMPLPPHPRKLPTRR